MRQKLSVVGLILLSLLSLKNVQGQPSPYAKLWAEYNTLENQGKVKDARSVAEKIYKQATDQGVVPEKYKALIHIYKCRMIIEENSETNIVNDLQQAIANSNKAEEKALLQMLLADSYYSYYQGNTYKIVNRTISDEEQPDFTYWDARQFNKQTTDLYLAALSQKDRLQQIPIKDVSAIVSGTGESSIQISTLYDLLANKATDFFSSQSIRLTEAKDAFTINQPELFSSAKTFTQYKIDTKDIYSSNYNAIHVLQQWLNAHAADQNDELAAYIDLKRLQFVYNHYLSDDKDELYEKALTDAIPQYKSKEAQALFRFTLAKFWHSNAPQNGKSLTDIKKYAAQIAKDYPKTKGAANAENLIKEILQRSLAARLEEAVAPNTPFKLFLEYKNLASAQFRIIAWNYDSKELNNKKYAEIWPVIKKQQLIRSGKFNLPASADHQNHSIEMALEGLAPGSYALVVYTDDIEQNTEASKISFVPFWSTRLSALSQENDKEISILVRDRITGLPLSNVQVSVQKYNNGKNNFENFRQVLTNQEGKITFQRSAIGQYAYYQIGLQNGKDKYVSRPNYLNDYRANEQLTQWQTDVQLFTDRSIYRPGQTVFFKGIAIKSTGAEYQPVADQLFKVQLKDANYQTVAEYEYTSNEFGSFSGFFQLPAGGLNGNYTIQTDFGQTGIQVEEYKRPTFEVTSLPVEGTFKLNDTITVKGKATAYSGAAISNATVNYIVTRTTQVPWWYSGYRMIWPPFPGTSKVIATGTAQTDPEGNYTVTFVATPDKGVKDLKHTYFSYDIKVDVTDISGEVRFSNTNLRVGALPLEPTLDVQPVWSKGKPEKVALGANNLQGQPVAATFHLNIQPLTAPTHPKKARYWEMPDQFSMTQAEHDKKFPFDLYKDEENKEEWAAGKTIWSSSVQVKGDSTLNILPGNLPAGVYRLTGKVILGSDTISMSKIFEVIENPGESNLPQFILVTTDRESYKAGDTIHISFNSDLEEAYLEATLAQNGKIFASRNIHLKGKIQTWSIPVTKEMVGNANLSYNMVAQNRNHTSYIRINVPFEQLDNLQYTWKTFRDKLKPGAEETWELTIRGAKGEMVASELLATLYDASLDQFLPHQYAFNVFRPDYGWYSVNNGSLNSFLSANPRNFQGNNFYSRYTYIQSFYPTLNNYGFQLGSPHYQYMYKTMAVAEMRSLKEESVVVTESAAGNAAPIADQQAAGSAEPPVVVDEDLSKPAGVVMRKDFSETAFFFPQLRTDTSGNVVLSFTIPEALTRWKFLGLAHTRDLHYALLQNETVTQKELMVILNKPRFVRAGDQITLVARISNLTDHNMQGQASLVIRDAATNEVINNTLLKTSKDVAFSIDTKGNSVATWNLEIPKDLEGITYEVTAVSGTFSDGESDLIPVLENRMLITESLPVFIPKKGKYEFDLQALKNKNSATAEIKALIFEYTSNPVWHALMALPYVAEQNNESATSLFNRYYANSVAAYILKQIPQSKELLEAWKKEGSLKSALEKKPELKSVVLEATPWLRDAQDETAQMQQLTRLFEEAGQKDLAQKLIKKLKELQASNGGISWFPGMPVNRYLTQEIVTGLGHLDRLGAIRIAEDTELNELTTPMLRYLDQQIREDFAEVKRTDSNYLKNDHLGYIQAQYLYSRSFFTDKKISKEVNEAYNYYIQQAKSYALSKNNYSRAMLALALHRNQDKKTPGNILEALRQSAVNSTQEGMYWKDYVRGGYWYQAPIETQALIIEAFNEIQHDAHTVNLLKTWLLRQKQTARWESTRATADACYALLLSGGDWKSVSTPDVITIGKKTLSFDQAQAGLGYIKETWEKEAITGDGDMNTIRIQKKSTAPSWGAAYLQYWEDLDKIEAASSDIKIRRTVYAVKNTDEGEKLIPVTASSPLQVGDKVRIKLELSFGRDMEFVHLQDARGAGFEPVTVLSGYKYQNGLGYYEVTGDASTHWYMDFVKKGNYTFEYTVFVTVAGQYSSGITTGECLYAPDYRGHSKGVVINVKY